MWDFAASSDPFVRVAITSSFTAAVITLLLFASSVLLRLRLQAGQRAEQKFLATWRPLLTQVAIHGIDPETDKQLPGMRAKKHAARRFLLNEWNIMHDCLKGSARNHLTRVGYRLGLDEIAWHDLKHSNSLGEQLLAIVTLGHLGDMGAWDEIVAELDSDNTLLSLMAAKALCNIDPDRAMPLLLKQILSRSDWADARIAGVLTEAGPAAISKPLRDAILRAGPEDQEKLIGFLPMVYKPVASTVIQQLLKSDVDDRVLGACLKVADGPLELEQVRELIHHPRWHIRMRAAIALGRFGQPEDCPRLLGLLADREWWVRYRAAQSLVGLPFVDRDELLAMRDSVDDPYGRDMMDQVLGEAALA